MIYACKSKNDEKKGKRIFFSFSEVNSILKVERSRIPCSPLQKKKQTNKQQQKQKQITTS